MTENLTEPKSLKKNVLGKGLNSLFGLDDNNSIRPHEVSNNKSADSNFLFVETGDIEPNPDQPRKLFRQDQIESLAASIKIDGILQPIIVSKGDVPGKYVIIAGERRWRAAQKSGISKVPVLLKETNSTDRIRIALIENIQRSDLTPIEEANAYLSLIEDHALSQEQCANKVGKDRTTVSNLIRLLALPKEIQSDIQNNILTVGHAKALLSLEKEVLIIKARDLIVAKKLNVRQTENLCKKIKKSGPNSNIHQAGIENPDLNYLAENLRNHLRTKVKFCGNASRGKIEIAFFSAAELERILSLIGLDQMN